MQHLRKDHRDLVHKPLKDEVSQCLCKCQTVLVNKIHYFQVLTGLAGELVDGGSMYKTFIQQEWVHLLDKSTKLLELLKKEELPNLLQGTH